MNRLRIAICISAGLMGCAGLIGVPDLELDENPLTGEDASARPETSTPPPPPPPDASETCVADLQTDPKHCGRCGHDCLGGACQAGVCKATSVGTVANAPIQNIVSHGAYIYVSTYINFTYEDGGIWKIAKDTGTPVPFVTQRYAGQMAVIGDTLYFINYDSIANGTDQFGGLWSCDLNGPTPCVPTLIKAEDEPGSLVVSNGKLYYGAEDLYEVAPPFTTPTVFRAGYGFSPISYVDGPDAFYMATIFAQYRSKVFQIAQDASTADELSFYEGSLISGSNKADPSSGTLLGNANALFFTAFDFNDPPLTGGVVRRIPKPGALGATACDFGGIKNKRPDGLHVDDANVYWTNRGQPASPWADGSLAYCSLTGCCADPTIMWEGTGEPSPLTGDDKALYWAALRTGNVYKIAKP